MEMLIENLLLINGQMTRFELEKATGMSDRVVRKEIARERDLGVDIVPASPSGYKLAETDEDIIRLENELIGKALTMLKRAKALRSRRQSKGQTILFGGNSGKHSANSAERFKAIISATEEAVEETEQTLEELLREFLGDTEGER